jgi:hypothetical protein
VRTAKTTLMDKKKPAHTYHKLTLANFDVIRQVENEERRDESEDR